MKKHRILIVDDEPGLNRLLKLNLEETGRYLVESITDPQKAVEAAERFQPDLALLDVMMSPMDGGELAAKLQAHPTLHGIPILFLTATAKKQEVKEHHGSIGGLPFIAKPVELPELLQRLEQLLPK